ncbi:hypothetical protein ACFPM7_22530 [Actinokineospora guangxiensis]|uniref:Uncharacterized protein n=1 Tax=Actinokineospora guangxiensis TaxID=1490288 RepID=A0ABW0EUC4_9PSEU
MDHYDVDQFNVLDPPSRQPITAAGRDRQDPGPFVRTSPVSEQGEPGLATAVRDEAKPVADTVAPSLRSQIEGHGNDTAFGNLHKSVVTIETAHFNDQLFQLAEARPRKRSGRGLQDRAGLQYMTSRYVAPSGLLDASECGAESALSILRREQVLLLTAKENRGGQFVAGLRLGHELQLGRPELVVREELIDRLSDDDLLIDNEPAVVVVDLRATPLDELQVVRRDLVELVKQFVAHHSYLVLIIPVDRAREFGEFLHGRLHFLECPEPVQVLQRHLEGISLDLDTILPELGDCLRDLWPPVVKEIADATRGEILGGQLPKLALKKVLRERQDQPGPSLREEVRAKQLEGSVDWLALILATALLEGASPHHIAEAADQMLDLNGTIRESTSPLLMPSPYARLAELDYEPFDVATCRFRPVGRGTEVFRYFWHEHRDLRTTLLKWIGDLPRQIFDLTRDELERFADRCAELSDCGGIEAVLKLAENWARTKPGTISEDKAADHGRARYCRSIAVRLLTTTATDPTAGARVRERLLAWSKGENPDLQLLTAQVCEGIGEAFPRIALNRLKHLADSRDQLVRYATRHATFSIGEDLGTSSFLRHVMDWQDKAGPARLRLLVESTATVFAQDSQNVDPKSVADFWRRALSVMPVEDLYPAIANWLGAAAEAPVDRWDRMIDPLVIVTDGDLRLIGLMHHAARQAVRHGRAEQNGAWIDISERLSCRLDEIDPLTPS